jgi:hypothetical protein
VGHDILLIAGRKGGQAYIEGLAKIESMSMAEEVRTQQTLANEYEVLPVTWVVLNKLVLGSMECAVGRSIFEDGQGLYEQVTEEEGEAESRVRSQRI